MYRNDYQQRSSDLIFLTRKVCWLRYGRPTIRRCLNYAAKPLDYDFNISRPHKLEQIQPIKRKDWLEIFRPHERLVRPPPPGHVRLVGAVFISIIPALDLHVSKFLLGVTTDPLKLRCAIDYVDCQAEAVYLIVDG